MTKRLAVLLCSVVCLLPSAVLRSQDTATVKGVRIGLTYAPGTRPGVLIAPVSGPNADSVRVGPGVLIAPVSGPNADSVRVVLARDLDFGDRITVIQSDGGEAPTGTLNYPVYASLGAAAVVQASVTPAGSLHIVVHDVGGARVMDVADYPLPAPALGAEWRVPGRPG